MRHAADVSNRTILESEIPPDHPAKEQIELALKFALSGLPGEWKIAVICSRTSVWWVVRVDGPHFEWMTVLPDPTRQNAKEITCRLLAGLSAAKVVS